MLEDIKTLVYRVGEYKKHNKRVLKTVFDIKGAE